VSRIGEDKVFKLACPATTDPPTIRLENDHHAEQGPQPNKMTAIAINELFLASPSVVMWASLQGFH